MTTKIVNGGFIISKSLDKYQMASYDRKQAEKPDEGVSATQICKIAARLDRINSAIRGIKLEIPSDDELIADEVEDEKDD
ncbi:hypothetical protein MCEMSEM29_01925 [Methylophilaceae bacterium]